MKKMNFIYILILVIALNTIVFAKQEKDSLTINENEFTIKLVTIGPGHDLPSWWGHTAIVVENDKSHQSKFYNYGLFSFEDENFLTNFAMGRLIFWVGSWNTDIALEYYRKLDRDIIIQEINLSREKCKKLHKFLENNIKPENRRYLYDHYYDNCSTRIRDIFEMITDGQLSVIDKQPGRMTFREHTRRHTYHHPIMDWILMFLMNDTIDKPILVANEMFLPSEMERVLDNFTYVDNEGNSQKFVKKKYIYYKSKTVPEVPETAPKNWPYTLALGILLGIIPIFIVWFPNFSWKQKRIIYGVYNAVVGLCFGFIGTVLVFMSFFTDHTVTYYNENIVLANPSTLLITLFGLLLAIGKLKRMGWLYYTWLTLFLIGISAPLAKLLPPFDQDNWQAITLILPIIIGFTISSFYWKKKF